MKPLVIAITLCIYSMSSYAQNFEAYVITGMSLSQMDGDKLSGYNKAGLIVGGATSFLLNEDWSFQQEIVYYQRGSKATVDQLSLDNFSIKRLDYIDIIAQASYHINDQWSVLGGLGYGVFLNVKSDVSEDSSLYKSDVFPTIGAQFRLTDNLYAALKAQYSMVSVFETQRANNNSIGIALKYKVF